VLRLAQQKEREGAAIPGGCPAPAKGLGEDVINGAAARPAVAARGKEEQGRRGFERRERRGDLRP